MALLAAVAFAVLLPLPASAQTAEPERGVELPLVDLGPGIGGQAATGFATSSSECAILTNTPASEVGTASCSGVEGASVNFTFTVGDTVSSDLAINRAASQSTSGTAWVYASRASVPGPLGSTIFVGTYRLTGRCNGSGRADLVLNGAGTYSVTVTCTPAFTALSVTVPASLEVEDSGVQEEASFTVDGTNAQSAECSARNSTTSGSANVAVSTTPATGTTRRVQLTVTSAGSAAGTVTVTCGHDDNDDGDFNDADDETATDQMTWNYDHTDGRSVVITGLQTSRSIIITQTAGGTWADDFDTGDAQAACSVGTVTGTAAGGAMSVNDGRSATNRLSVSSTGPGTVTATITCTVTGIGSDTATVTITFQRVTISSLAATGSTTAVTYTDTFTVAPDVTCTAARFSGLTASSVGVTRTSAAGRSLAVTIPTPTATGGTDGDMVVLVTCGPTDGRADQQSVSVSFDVETRYTAAWRNRQAANVVLDQAATVVLAYEVSPATASCVVERRSGDATFSDTDTDGAVRSITAVYAAEGDTVFRVTCGELLTGNTASDEIRLRVTATPQVRISGLLAADSTITGTLATTFTVSPASASCTDDSASASVGVDVNSASLRHLTITRTVGSGAHTVRVTCTSFGHDPDTATITATFNDPPPPGADTASWTDGSAVTYTGDEDGAATITLAYSVSPDDRTCTVTRQSGTATLDATTDTTGAQRSATLTFTAAGTTVVRAACGNAPNADISVTVSAASGPAQEVTGPVTITGLTANPTETTNRYTQSFSTNPASATCTHARTGGITATWSTSGKTLTVAATVDGVAQGQVVCSASGFSDGIENVNVNFGTALPATAAEIAGTGYEFLGGAKSQGGGGVIQVFGSRDGRAVTATDGGLESVFGVSFYSPSWSYGRIDFTQTAVTSCSVSRRGGSSGITYTLSQRRYQRISDSEWVTSSSGAAYVGYARTIRATGDGSAVFRITCGAGSNRGQTDVTVVARQITRSGDTIQPFTGTDSVMLQDGTGTATVNVRTIPTSLTCTVARTGGTLTVSPTLGGSAGSYTVSATSTAVGTLTYRVTCGTVSRSGTFTFTGRGEPTHTIDIASRGQTISGATTISLPFTVTPARFDCTVERSGGTLNIAPDITTYQNGGVHQFVTATSSTPGTLGITLTCGDAVASATMTWTDRDVATATITGFEPVTVTLTGDTATAARVFTVAPLDSPCTVARTGGSLVAVTPTVGAHINGGIYPYVSVTSSQVGTVEATLTCGAATATARFTFAAPPAPTYAVTRFENRTAFLTDGVGRAQSTYTVTPFRGDCTVAAVGGSLAPGGVLASGVTVSALAHIDGLVQPYVEVVTRMVGTVNVRVTCGSAAQTATFEFRSQVGQSDITGFAGRTVAIVDGVGRAQSTYTVVPYRGDCTAVATSGSLMDTATVLPLAHINGVVQPYVEVVSRTAGSVTVTLTCGSSTSSAIFTFTETAAAATTITNFADRTAEVIDGIGRAQSTYTVSPYRGDCTVAATGGDLQSGGTLDPGVTLSALAHINGVIQPYVEVLTRMTGTLDVTITCGTATATATFTFTAIGGAAITIMNFAGGTFPIVSGVGRAQSTYTVTPYRGDCTAAATGGALQATATVLSLAHINGVIQPYIEVQSRVAGSVTVTVTCGPATTSAIFTFTAPAVTITGFPDQSGLVGRTLSAAFSTTPRDAGVACSIAAVSGIAVSIQQPRPIYLPSGAFLWHVGGAQADAEGIAVLRLTCGTESATATFTWAPADDPLSGVGAVVITGLLQTQTGTFDRGDGPVFGSLTLSDTFTVGPTDATCTHDNPDTFNPAALTATMSGGSPTGEWTLQVLFTRYVGVDFSVTCSAADRASRALRVQWRGDPTSAGLADPPPPDCPAGQEQTISDGPLVISELACVVSMVERVTVYEHYRISPETTDCSWSVLDTAATRRWSIPQNLVVAYSTTGTERHLRLRALEPGAWQIQGICIATVVDPQGIAMRDTYTVNRRVRAVAVPDPAGDLPSLAGFESRLTDFDGRVDIFDVLAVVGRCFDPAEAEQRRYDSARDNYLTIVAEYGMTYYDWTDPRFQGELAALSDNGRMEVRAAYVALLDAEAALFDNLDSGGSGPSWLNAIPILGRITSSTIDFAGATFSFLRRLPQALACAGWRLWVPDNQLVRDIFYTHLGNRGAGCRASGVIERCTEGSVLFWPVEAVAEAAANPECAGPLIEVSPALHATLTVGSSDDGVNVSDLTGGGENWGTDEFGQSAHLTSTLDGHWFSTCDNLHGGVWERLWAFTAFAIALNALMVLFLALLLWRAVKLLWAEFGGEVHTVGSAGGSQHSGHKELGP